MKVTIIGAGNMGRGIGMRAVAGGHELELIDRTRADAEALAAELGGSAAAADSPSGEVVVLALPYEAVADVLAEHAESIGRAEAVVDITNPVDWSTMDRLVTPAGSSAAEQIAGKTSAPVVKAFNTTFAGTLAAGEAAGQQLDVLIAGDDEQAKRKVVELIESGGQRAIDVGPLARARQLEQVGLFHMAIQEQLGSGFGSALKLYW